MGMTRAEDTMKTNEEPLANTAEEMDRQAALLQAAARALAALGDVPLRVPAAVLAELDATVLRAEAITRRAVIHDGVKA
jgi:hypothetical protein